MLAKAILSSSKRLTAMLVSLGVMSCVLYILLGLSRIPMDVFEKQTVRTIDMTLPPPLPPPPEEVEPIKDYNNPQPSINLTGIAGGPNIEFTIKPKIAMKKIHDIPKPEVKIDFGDIHSRLQSAFPVFEVHELDKTPKIVRSKNSKIPKSLQKKGIKHVRTKVEILIDERGQAHVKKILDAGHIEMIPVIREHIEFIRFTPPTKNGQIVNAIYLFKLSFKEAL